MIKNEPLLSEETLAKIKREITVQEAKAVTVAREGQVWIELENLGRETANLESAIKELGTRLNPISHPIAVEHQDENVGHDLSEVPGNIRSYSTRISDLVRDVNHMLEGLDI